MQLKSLFFTAAVPGKVPAGWIQAGPWSLVFSVPGTVLVPPNFLKYNIITVRLQKPNDNLCLKYDLS